MQEMLDRARTTVKLTDYRAVFDLTSEIFSLDHRIYPPRAIYPRVCSDCLAREDRERGGGGTRKGEEDALVVRFARGNVYF